MASLGRVRVWHDDDGWGVLDSPATPGGCWAHYSAVLVPGHRSLTAGQAVSFVFEVPGQDGFDFRAVGVWPAGVEPLRADGVVVDGPSAAYSSALRLSFDGGGGDDRGGDGSPASP